MVLKSECIMNYAYHDGGLEITFTGGRVYRYEDAPASLVHGLRTAASQGRYYNTFIRGKYYCREIPLRRVVDMAWETRARIDGTKLKCPEIDFCNDVIIVGNKPYAGGAQKVMEYFLGRVEVMMEELINAR